MRSFTLALCAALALPVMAACNDRTSTPAPSSQGAGIGGLPDKDPELAHRLVRSGAVLLDVRSPPEYAERHISGAVNVPVDDLPNRTADVAKLTSDDKNKPIVVYCASGARAARAKTMLLAEGYRQVTNLGGIDAWGSESIERK